MIFLGLCWLLFRQPANKKIFFTKHKLIKTPSSGFNQPKPKWVKNEIIRLKALMPNAGVRTIADVFNRRYKLSRQMTVGKTFVYTTVKNNLYEVQVVRRKLKHKKPKSVPHNLIWAMDLTGKTDDNKNTHSILSIVEHQSRACLILESITSKASINLLRTLLDIIEKYGTPKIIRTDNEAIFKSKLFNFYLWMLRIKHQYTELHCPWQNGRVERFFGTLKSKPLWFDEWDGLLTGDYFHK